MVLIWSADTLQVCVATSVVTPIFNKYRPPVVTITTNQLVTNFVWVHLYFYLLLSSLGRYIGTSAFYSRQLCLCPFPAYSVFSPPTSFPSTKWSETCTTTLILLISVSFEIIWGGDCNMHLYHHNKENYQLNLFYLNLETKYNAKAIGTYRHHSTYKSDM